MLLNAGISEIVFDEDYKDKLSIELLAQSDITVRNFKLGDF